MQNKEFSTHFSKSEQASSLSDKPNIDFTANLLSNSNKNYNPTQNLDKSIKTTGGSRWTKVKNFFVFHHLGLCCFSYSTVQDNSDEEWNHSQQSQSQSNEIPIYSNVVNVQPKDASVWIDINIFQQLDQSIITEPFSFIKLQPPPIVPIYPGATFLAYCANTSIHDNVIPVLIAKGFYLDSRGQFTLSEEVTELHCPVCKQRISDNNPTGIGFRDCVTTIKYRDTNEKVGQFNLTTDKDTFAFAKFSQPGSVKYYFIKFNVELSN